MIFIQGTSRRTIPYVNSLYKKNVNAKISNQRGYQTIIERKWEYE